MCVLCVSLLYINIIDIVNYPGFFGSVDEKDNDISGFNGASDRVDGDNHHAVFGL